MIRIRIHMKTMVFFKVRNPWIFICSSPMVHPSLMPFHQRSLSNSWVTDKIVYYVVGESQWKLDQGGSRLIEAQRLNRAFSMTIKKWYLYSIWNKLNINKTSCINWFWFCIIIFSLGINEAKNQIFHYATSRVHSKVHINDFLPQAPCPPHKSLSE